MSSIISGTSALHVVQFGQGTQPAGKREKRWAGRQPAMAVSSEGVWRAAVCAAGALLNIDLR